MIALALLLVTATPEVTFLPLSSFVGEVCTEKSTMSIRLSGAKQIIDAFGSERTGDVVVERKTLEMKDGRVSKLRVRYLVDQDHLNIGGRKETQNRARHGQTYVLTRIDTTDDFVGAHEDGTTLSPAENETMKGELHHASDDLLAGRAMKLKEKLVFDAAAVKRYFSFQDVDGQTITGFEMSLGAIEKKGTVRIDIKLLYDVARGPLDASLKAWATIHTDLAQRNTSLGLEGPVRARVSADQVVTGTYEGHVDATCTPAPPPPLAPLTPPATPPPPG